MKICLGTGTCALLLSMVLAGCARQEDSGTVSGAAPANEQGSAQTEGEIANADGTSTRLNSVVTTTNAGPETGVGAATAASSGVGTATASASTAVESDAAARSQISTGDTNNLGNSGNSAPQRDGANE